MTTLGDIPSQCSSVNGEHAVRVIEREGHVIRQVSAFQAHRPDGRLIDVALQGEGHGIGLQTRHLIVLGRLDADDHLLAGAEGVAFIGEGIQGKVAVATAVPTPIDMVTAIAVIAIDVEGVARTRVVVIGTIDNRAACLEFGLDQCGPLGIAIVVIAQVIGLEQQLGVLVILEVLHGTQDVLAIGTAARDGVVHLFHLTDVTHQVGYGRCLNSGVSAGVVIEHIVPVEGLGRQLGQYHAIGRYHIGRGSGRLLPRIPPVMEHHRE